MAGMPYQHRFRPDRAALRRLIDEQHGGNVSAAARAAGITPPALHDILKGRRVGRTETLQAIAKGLGVGMADITERVPA